MSNAIYASNHSRKIMFYFHLGLDGELVDVETYVLQKLCVPHSDDSQVFISAIDSGGWQGWHCEGSVIYAIYGLLMWDVIYSDCPDVFLTPYQDAPLDIHYPSYYNSRLVQILFITKE